MSIAYLDPGNIESDLQAGSLAQYQVCRAVKRAGGGGRERVGGGGGGSCTLTCKHVLAEESAQEL